MMLFVKRPLIKNIIAGILVLAISIHGSSQCTSPVDVWTDMHAITGSGETANNKLNQLKILLKQFEKCGYQKDSVYTRLLNRISLFEYLGNNDISAAIKYGQLSVVNANSAAPGFSWMVSSKAYNNLAFYYRAAMQYNSALDYFDTAIIIAKNRPECADILLESRIAKCIIYFEKGDYQKCVDESNMGLFEAKQFANNNMLAAFYNHKAQSLFFQGYLKPAAADADHAIATAESVDNLFEMASGLKCKALIASSGSQFGEAQALFERAIALRKQTGGSEQVADDYTDYGNFLVDSMHNYQAGIKSYLNVVRFAGLSANAERLSKAYANISQVYFRQQKLEDAQKYLVLSFQKIKLDSGSNLYQQLNASQLSLFPNKDLLFALVGNKLELLLKIFTVNGNRQNLVAALKLAMVADSVITYCRHEQLGEQSKLYWRKKTRAFYTNAIEVCYQANDIAHAFYFLEKSRAVLLNDKLNELGALSRLPATEASKELDLRLKVLLHQQNMAQFASGSAAYFSEQQQLLNAKVNVEQFIKSLEKKYPAYYQLKYADKVPTLTALQQYLKRNNQNMLHYFMADTVAFIMAISGDGTVLKKISKRDYDSKLLTTYLQLCSNPALLNANYSTYVSLADSINRVYFQPLKIPKGRVIICPDNYLIPFESLLSKSNGSRYLVEDYAFSYVYSARTLLMDFQVKNSNGNYLGIAPITFASFLHAPQLLQSAEAANRSANFFSGTKLITGKNASKKSFLQNVDRYAVVNVYSHALADSSIREPAIYMGDSLVYLSELQLLHDIRAQLVLLSACQTNVGNRATGEGIYSLARGFSAVGIPAVAATLWNADEASIYMLSEKFNEHIASGMAKDIALQQAKIWLLKNSDKEKTLPAYWSNMILIGNTSPVQLTRHHNYLLWIAILFFCCILIFFIARKISTSKKNKLLKIIHYN